MHGMVSQDVIEPIVKLLVGEKNDGVGGERAQDVRPTPL
jgi:hypothetical protein